MSCLRRGWGKLCRTWESGNRSQFSKNLDHIGFRFVFNRLRITYRDPGSRVSGQRTVSPCEVGNLPIESVSTANWSFLLIFRTKMLSAFDLRSTGIPMLFSLMPRYRHLGLSPPSENACRRLTQLDLRFAVTTPTPNSAASRKFPSVLSGPCPPVA